MLKDEAAARHNDLLERMPQSYYSNLGEDEYYTDCENRRATAGYSFEIDNRGFTSKINLPRENLVFYSVPYDEGWSATVNGVPAEIEKVDLGFMAVRAPAGDNTIRFTYTTPGLYPGLAVSAGALLILIVYLLLYKKYGGAKGPDQPYSAHSDFDRLDGKEQEPPAEWL